MQPRTDLSIVSICFMRSERNSDLEYMNFGARHQDVCFDSERFGEMGPLGEAGVRTHARIVPE